MTGSRGAARVAAGLALWASIAAAQPPHEELTLRLNPQTRELDALAVIALQSSGQVYLTLGSRFEVTELTLNGQALNRRSERVGEHQRWVLMFGKREGTQRVVVRYRGRLDAVPQADHQDVLNGLPAMASERGMDLASQACK